MLLQPRVLQRGSCKRTAIWVKLEQLFQEVEETGILASKQLAQTSAQRLQDVHACSASNGDQGTQINRPCTCMPRCHGIFKLQCRPLAGDREAKHLWGDLWGRA